MFCFKNLFGLEETPYLKQDEGKRRFWTTNFPLYTGPKVRSVIHCYRCQKPRCIYSPRQLTATEQKTLEEVKNETVFTCNSSLIPPLHFLQGKVFLKELSCSDEVEREYYTSPLQNPSVCYNCGIESGCQDVQITHLLEEFRLVVPSCSGCHSAGKGSKGFYPITKPSLDFYNVEITSLNKKMIRKHSL